MADDTVSGGTGTETTFSQDQVNSLLAEERRKHQQKIDKIIKDTENLTKEKELTAQQKAALEAQIEELRTANMTTEEKAKRDLQRIEKDNATKLETLTKERDAWQTKFNDSTINRALLDAAIEYEAVNPEPIIAMLRANTRMVDSTDEYGNVTQSPKVKIQDVVDGKSVTLDLTVSEAVKRMQEMPERYGNLFKSTLASGLGKSGAKGGTMTLEALGNLPMSEYLAYTKKHGIPT